jgi:hypothetical protein
MLNSNHRSLLLIGPRELEGRTEALVNQMI